MIGLLATGIALPDGGRSRPGGRRTPIADLDEDVITLAVAAAERCLARQDRSRVTALYLATTSGPFAERSTAALAARILDLPGNVRTVDFSGSLRSGTDALLAAFETAATRGGAPVLVVASEVRRPEEGSRDAERNCDAAVAFLVGEGDACCAVLKANASTTGRALGPLRRGGETSVRPAAGALFGSLAYAPAVAAAAKLLFTRFGYSPSSFRYVLMDAPDGHCHLRPAVDLGLDVDVQLPADPLLGLGHAGTAHPLLLLAWAIPRCAAGEQVLLVSWGEGADALVLEMAPGVLAVREDQPFRTALTSVKELPAGEARLRWRRASQGEAAVIPRAAGEVHEGFVPLRGYACQACGAVLAIPFAVCPACGERDSARGKELGRTGVVYTYTGLHGVPGRPAPLLLAVVDLVGGGRMLVQFAGKGAVHPAIGDEVELVLRRLYDSPRGPIYHYKARLREETP